MIRPYEFVSARRWCPPVDGFARLLAGEEGHWVARAGHDEIVPAADLGGPGERRLRLGPAFVAALDDVRVQVADDSFNVFPMPSLALAETWHDEASHTALARRLGAETTLRAGETEVSCRLYDDAPPDLRIEPPALMLASRFAGRDYAHWLVDLLPRLWALSLFDRPASVPLLVPGPDLTPWRRETLLALGIANPIIPLACRVARIERMFLPSFFAPGGISRVQVQWIGGRLRRAFGVEGGARGPRRLLVLPEGWSPAALDGLRGRGFEPMRPEGMTVAAQARLFAAARVVVAPHHPVCANLLFARPGTALIEIAPAGAGDRFHLLAGLGGQRYGRLDEEGLDAGALAAMVAAACRGEGA
ncbi:MAG: glycosyltransferase family 61 protein [Alphaproteobacteria bacterium]|nr:glycosyltransferase family 61 protein [Alphaproteobacteria bacterium]